MKLGHALGLAHDDRADPTTSGPKIMRPVNFGSPTEVDLSELSTLSFLYNHTDAADGNSGDLTPPAGAAAELTRPRSTRTRRSSRRAGRAPRSASAWATARFSS